MPQQLNNHQVSVGHLKNPIYPKPPFNPPKCYPELGRLNLNFQPDPGNEIYDLIRKLFQSFNFDKEHENSAAWNPLKSFIQPGDRVFIKPNLVFHHHKLGDDGVLSMITHGSLLRPIIDYVWLALNGKGKILIGDVPLQTASWQILIEKTGLKALVNYYHHQNIPVSLLDLRLERATSNRYGVITHRKLFNGDPLGYIAVDLGAQSQLMPVINRYQKLMITDYPPKTVSHHHNPKKNEYLIAKSVLAADVFINLPKLKTHKKAGVTLSMKNLIGINGDKSWIAHHRQGPVRKGGDEYPNISSVDWLKYRLFVNLKHNSIGVWVLNLLLFFLRLIASIEHFFWPTRQNIMQLASVTEGSWYGNDTLWRVIIDLNRILLYADQDGRMGNKTQRKYLTIIDGVWAGQQNGPMHHLPKKPGVIIGGLNPVLTDIVATHLMGFDWQKIPHLSEATKTSDLDLNRLSIIDNFKKTKTLFPSWSKKPTFAFAPPTSWVGHVEHSYRNPNDESPQRSTIEENIGGAE